ncbi:hypothetical protein BDQ12DRAFT_667709 [Crucibulum laeve]|uniref:Uncharacterized protein n=1 Tax=Crucibulum laeve TaxID=68775 RepID=A0A5C3LTX1_9AGAR|nr:hypothetical protein BDQ12DRAFT_667709 [Crucibulum laeve]
MADKDNEMEIDFATPQPIHDASPHTSMHQDIQSKLGPILEKLSGHYSPLAKSNPYIFVNKDNIWSVKGWYAKAIIENENIDWIASSSGQLTLPILVEGINFNQSQAISFDALSLASSHSDSHSASASVSGSVYASASASASTSAPEYPFATNSVQYLIATTLNIPFNLTDHQRGDIQKSYTKYLAIEDTRSHLKQLKDDGLWTAKLPLEKWLKGDPTAKSTLEVWGPYKPSFGNIPIVVKEYLAEIAEEKRVQDKEKEKEKKKPTKHSKKNLM